MAGVYMHGTFHVNLNLGATVVRFRLTPDRADERNTIWWETISHEGCGTVYTMPEVRHDNMTVAGALKRAEEWMTANQNTCTTG